MEYFFKIKPYTVPNDQGYGFANAITWMINDVYRGCNEATAYCNLLNVSTWDIPDNSGGTTTSFYISPSLMSFEMIVPYSVLNSWGADDTVIDDYVLTYDPNFERE